MESGSASWRKKRTSASFSEDTLTTDTSPPAPSKPRANHGSKQRNKSNSNMISSNNTSSKKSQKSVRSPRTPDSFSATNNSNSSIVISSDEEHEGEDLTIFQEPPPPPPQQQQRASPRISVDGESPQKRRRQEKQTGEEVINLLSDDEDGGLGGEPLSDNNFATPCGSGGTSSKKRRRSVTVNAKDGIVEEEVCEVITYDVSSMNGLQDEEERIDMQTPNKPIQSIITTPITQEQDRPRKTRRAPEKISLRTLFSTSPSLERSLDAGEEEEEEAEDGEDDDFALCDEDNRIDTTTTITAEHAINLNLNKEQAIECTAADNHADINNNSRCINPSTPRSPPKEAPAMIDLSVDSQIQMLDHPIEPKLDSPIRGFGGPRWGIFGDIHFQDRGLQRVVDTGQWIIDLFRQHKVTNIICLGDVLNTRETVSVQSLSAAVHFFDELASIAPVHIILGNHDMNLKHSSKVSSLDAFGMANIGKNINLYREMSLVTIEGRRCAMIPYQEDQQRIKEWTMKQTETNEYALRETTAFVHMAIPGSIQRYQRDNRMSEVTKRFEEAGSTSPPAFLKSYKRVISGHFHHHQWVSDTILYCGAPMQHHFGDAGDDKRGVLIYDPLSDQVEFKQNPEWDKFRVLRVAKMSDLNNPRQFKGKHVSIVYESKDVRPDDVQQTLINAGAQEARKHSVTVSQVSLPQLQPGQRYAVDILESFVKEHFRQQHNVDNKEQRVQEVIKCGLDLIRAAEEKDPKKSRSRFLDRGQAVFEASLKRLTMQNFLGVRQEIVIDFDKMPDGMWFIEGDNGAGKSTILEAITWCLFNQCIRNGMKADDVINDTAKKNCRVTVEFKNGYKIERCRQPTSLRVFHNGKKIETMEKGELRHSQQALQDLLGIDYNTFTKAIVIGESTVSSLTSNSGVRRSLIEELLGLSRFEDYLIETRLTIKGEEGQARFIEQEVTRVSNQIHVAVQSITSDSATIEKNTKEIAEIVQQLQQLAKRADDLAQRKQRNEEELKELEKQWELHTRQEHNKHVQRLQKEQKLQVLYHKLELRAQQERMRQQQLQHQQREVQKKQAHLDQLRSSIKALEEKLHQKQALMPRLEEIKLKEDEITQLEQQQRTLKEQLQVLDFDIRSKRQKKKVFDDRIAEIHKLISMGKCPTCHQHVNENVMAEVSDLALYIAEQKQHQNEIEELLKQQAGVKEQHDSISSTISTERTALQRQLSSIKGTTTVNVNYHHHSADAELFHINQELNWLTREIQSQQAVVSNLEASLEEAIIQQQQQQQQQQAENTNHQPDGDDESEEELRQAIQKIVEESQSVAAAAAASSSGEIRHWTHCQSFPELTASRYRELAEAENALNIQKVRLDSMQASLEKQNHELRARIASQERVREQLQAELDAKLKLLREARARLDLLRFWEKAFDKKLTKKEGGAGGGGGQKSNNMTMRAYMLEHSIRDLNAILEEYSHFLGSTNDLTLTLNNKLEINEAYCKRSAGQRRRNDLAVMFAFFELVRQSCNFRADFLMLDEAFDSLDSKGQESVRSVIETLCTPPPIPTTTTATGAASACSSSSSSSSTASGAAPKISKIFIITHSTLMDRPRNWIRVEMVPGRGTKLQSSCNNSSSK